MQEWKILENNLPETIYVRVYDQRMDLLRAVIVGAAGTPYHDGLFFFDFSFPPDYPNSPPNAHYHAHGMRLNPNLYSNGKICLSLLNTWIGEKEARWNPRSSTIPRFWCHSKDLFLIGNPSTMSRVVLYFVIKSYQGAITTRFFFYLVRQCWSC